MPSEEEVQDRLAQARARFEGAFAGDLGRANSEKWLQAAQASAPNWEAKFLDVFQAQLTAAEKTRDKRSFERLTEYSKELQALVTTPRRGGAATKPAGRSAAGEQQRGGG